MVAGLELNGMGYLELLHYYKGRLLALPENIQVP